ncbi:HD-GYP domain-containing protein [Bacillus sp. EAC]|uniref:HD-GYP domain-containing protein n=1 Tax=Bacillus sp. EAC TaxID=1978338 RepID=UPI000B444F03|nr:HD domain-containing phosphohydrolase [Bacillus sp. EAC]
MSELHSSELQLIGNIHDIGKLNIPLSILKKCAPLTDFEWNIMKKHAMFGYNLLEPLIEQKEILYAVRYHHENSDGTGYEGLIVRQIDFYSRLVRIIDSFDALTNGRCYKHKYSTELSLNKILQLAGSSYDADLVNQFIKIINN